MKVLVLNGSPKHKSDTMHMTQAFLSGLNSKGNCKIKEYRIIDLKVGPCLGCLTCWAGEKIECIQKDDMAAILQDILWSDLIIWSFPLYCYGMPSHLKAVCDRLLPLTKMDMREYRGAVIHESKVNLSSKKYIMISGCGFPNFERNFMPAIMQFKNCFGQEALTICVPEAPMFNAVEAEAVTKPLLEKIKEAGTEYFNTGTLSKKTIESVQVPMISNELYIKIINSKA